MFSIPAFTTLAFLLLSPLTITALPFSPIPTLRPPQACLSTQPLNTPRINIISRPDLDFAYTQTLVFTLPSSALSGSGPCTLQARFPPGWEVFDSRAQAGGQPLAVGVYDVDGPAAGSLVGVARFAAPKGSDPGLERTVVINSFACRETMTFGLGLVDGDFGEIGFVNGWDKGLDEEGGVEMVYGC